MIDVFSIMADEVDAATVEAITTGGGFGEAESIDGNIETYDVFGVRFLTTDGKEHQLVLTADQVVFLFDSIAEWVSAIHAGGRCGCNDGHAPE